MAKQVVCFDIQFSAELIKALDDKIALYSKEADEEEKDQNTMEIDVSFSHIVLAAIFHIYQLRIRNAVFSLIEVTAYTCFLPHLFVIYNLRLPFSDTFLVAKCF